MISYSMTSPKRNRENPKEEREQTCVALETKERAVLRRKTRGKKRVSLDQSKNEKPSSLKLQKQ